MCQSKAYGGMGFREFVVMNKTLLARTAWMILKNTNE